MSGKVELTLTEDRTEQARGEKADVQDRVTEAVDKANAEDRGNQQARNEASVCGSGDCNGLGPSVGVIINYYPAETLASAVKRLNKKIRITLTLSSLDSLTDDEQRILQTIEILVVQPSVIQRSPLIYQLPNLRWIQSLGAGVDQIISSNESNKPPPTFILTRNVGAFDRQMADFVVTMIIARERHFREHCENQTKRIWMHQRPSRSLNELSIGIIGFGNIGKEVARVAKFFGLSIWALVRSAPTESTKCPDVDEYRLIPDLGDLLTSCDYVISVLPSTPSTDGFFDGDTLAKGKTKKPVFMNIGRGNVIDDSTIIHALNEGWISHAILDVFKEEPLPVDSPLWTHPQVTITPHDSATGFSEKAILRNFLENYERYINGDELLHTVDWTKGY